MRFLSIFKNRVFAILCFLTTYQMSHAQLDISQTDSISILPLNEVEIKDSIDFQKLNNKLGGLNSKDPVLAQKYYQKLESSEIENNLANEIQFIIGYGWNHLQRGSADSASLLLNKALDLVQEHGEYQHLSLIYRNLGAVNMAKVKYTKSLDYYQQALTHCDTVLYRKSYMTIMNMIGHLHRKLKDYDLALNYLNKALKIAKETSDSSEPNILNEIANVYYYLKEYDKVRDMDHALADHSRKIGNIRQLGFNLNNLGEDYAAIEEYETAIRYFKESIYYKKQSNNPEYLISTYIGLATTYTKLGLFGMSDRYLDSTKTIADRRTVENRMQYYEAGFKVMRMRGEDTEALNYHLQFIEKKDSIYNRNNFSELAELRTKYETEQKEKANLILQQENLESEVQLDRQRYWVLTLSIGAVLLFVLLFISYRFYLERKRVANQLNQDKTTITKQADKLKSLDAFKTRFFANVSHDLRTPLTLILGHIFQIKTEEEYLNAKSKDSLKKLEKNANKLVQLTDEIRNLILLEEDKLVLRYQKIEVTRYMKRLVELFHSAASLKNINLHFDNSIDREKIVHVDPQQFEKIVYNLISNALKFTQEGGDIKVALSGNDDCFEFIVQDDGVGIAEEKVDHIFDRFYQASEEVHHKEGIGIGLALALELTELHGGKIKAESAEQKGTKFTVVLPLNLDKVTEGIAPVEPLIEALETVPNNAATIDLEEDVKRRKGAQVVLIVDDHPDIREYIAGLVQDHYVIRQAGNGNEALDVLSKEQIDVIITDLMMPWMDGFGLIEEVKKSELLKNIPIVVVSARTTEEDKIKVLEQGVSDFLAKPFKPEELKLRIDNAVNSKSQNNGVWDDLATDNKKLNDVQRNILAKVNTIILSRIDDSELSVQSIADELIASRRSAYRMINELTGMNPKDYIYKIRFQYVEDLLKKRKVKSLTEAAKSIGMSNPTHFGKQFEKIMRSHPSELLEKPQLM